MTGTDIAVQDEPQSGTLALRGDQIEWSKAQQAALQHIGIADAPEGDQQVFMHVAQRTGLDPFARQIYMIGRKERGQNGKPDTVKYTIQTGIDGFRLIAERHPQYRGQVGPQWCGPDGVWRDVWLDPQKPPVAARVGVLRADREEPVWGVALFREYAQTTTYQGNTNLTKMWREKGAHMVAKCAEALAVRRAFPQEIGGLVTDDEMGAAGRGFAGVPPAVRSGVTAAELTGAAVVHDGEIADDPPQTSSPGKPATAVRDRTGAAAPTPPPGPPQPDPSPGGPPAAPPDGEPRAKPIQLRQLGKLLDEAEIAAERRPHVVGALLGATVTDLTHLTVAQAQAATDELRRRKKTGAAADGPAPDGPEPDTAPEPAAPPKDDRRVNARMFALLGDAGLGGDEMRDRRLALIGNIIGAPITTTSDMTDEQRSRVISALERYSRDGDLEQAEARAQEDAHFDQMAADGADGQDDADGADQ